MSVKFSNNVRRIKPVSSVATALYLLCFGSLIGISILKFGNPCTFEGLVLWPEGGVEWFLSSWPVKVGYVILSLLAVTGAFMARWKSKVPRWLLVMPVFWLIWQIIAATRTLDLGLTLATLPQFIACVACFFIGVSCAGNSRADNQFWLPILAAFVAVILWGFQQHFGGLQAARDYFFTYLYPEMESVPPEYYKKISSNRIFSTLFYPNSLAGLILLLLPPLLVVVWQQSDRCTIAARGFLVGCLAFGGIACLYWSGSKGGWLLALFLILVSLLHMRFSVRVKCILVALVVLAGGAGFALKYAGFFQRGATSVVARFDYWKAGSQTALANPILGTGPGTFGESYKRIKRPESEMAKLAHNDYLQQASDSGIPGFISYVGWVVGILILGYRKTVSATGSLTFCVWLGLVGWACHSMLEFGLYIPAISWTAFALSGWLIGRDDRFTPEIP